MAPTPGLSQLVVRLFARRTKRKPAPRQRAATVKRVRKAKAK